MIMKLLTYLQQTYGLSRRTITAAIQDGSVFVNGQKVEWFGTILEYGQVLTGRIADKHLNDTISDTNIKSEIILFHKPVGYVCSKFDNNNKTIYRLLGDQYRNYYYIGRLDKESRGLVMLCNDPKIVDQYEHPRNKITKEYIVTAKVRDQDFVKRLVEGTKDERVHADSSRDFVSLVQKLFVKWLLVDEDGKLAKKDNKNADLLKVVSLEMIVWSDKLLRQFGIQEVDPRGKIFNFRIILNEGKKRHIRRLLSAIGGEVLDLVRVRIGEYTLDGLSERDTKVIW